MTVEIKIIKGGIFFSYQYNPQTLHSPSMEFYRECGLVYNPDDDTFTRFDAIPTITTEAHNSLSDQKIFTKDFPLNTTHNTWLRLYRPITPPLDDDHTKLPLILYFHYGGFAVCSASNTDVNDICTAMSSELSAVVLSLEYRLAPEHRLPAAYEDAVEALTWIQNQALSPNDDFNQVDFTKVYLMGSSAGGNMVYHAGLHVLSLDLEPVVIRGYIFDHPAFGAVERSGSELRLANDSCLSLAVSDLTWKLVLPKGCNRDHEYCNPLIERSYKDKIGMLGRCMLNTNGGDILSDYGLEFAKMLERNGVEVVIRFQEEGGHVSDIVALKEKAGKAFLSDLQQFLSL